MPVMVDSVVLLHALGVALGRITEASDYWADARASHSLVENAADLGMSAVNWFELMRGMTPAQMPALARWRGRLAVFPIDARVAERAGEIYLAARSTGEACRRCFALLKSLPCTVCGNHRGESQRSHDILMVATADVSPEVPVLYSWDGGVLALASFVRNVEIKRPPPPPPQQIGLEGIVELHQGGATGAVRSRDEARCPYEWAVHGILGYEKDLRMSELGALIRAVRSGVLKLQCLDEARRPLGSGSGFLVDGAFVTNDHVLDGPYRMLQLFLPDRDLPIEFSREEIESAKMYRSPHPDVQISGPRYDCNIIAINHAAFSGRFRFTLADELEVGPGDQVLYLGYPFGYQELTAHVGHISGIPDDTIRHRTRILQIDGSVNGGNSGGPLIDIIHGHVQGIVTAAETGILLDEFDKMMQEMKAIVSSLAMSTGVQAIVAGVDARVAFRMIFERLIGVSNMLRRSANVGIGYAVPTARFVEAYQRLKNHIV